MMTGFFPAAAYGDVSQSVLAITAGFTPTPEPEPEPAPEEDGIHVLDFPRTRGINDPVN